MTERYVAEYRIEQAQAAVEARLAERIGDTHSYLSNPEQRRSVGDVMAAELTYGEVVLRDYEEPLQIPGMPHAVICDDPAVKVTLTDGHVTAVENYLSNSRCHATGPLVVGGYDTVPLGNLSGVLNVPKQEVIRPYVGGYLWFSGTVIPLLDRSGLVILQPWMVPSTPGGSPVPLLFAYGNPPIEQVRSLAAYYAEYDASLTD